MAKNAILLMSSIIKHFRKEIMEPLEACRKAHSGMLRNLKRTLGMRLRLGPHQPRAESEQKPAHNDAVDGEDHEAMAAHPQ